MEIDIQHRPSATVARCVLQAGDSMTAESGGLMALKGPIQMTTTTHQKKGGGIFSGLKRMLSAQSFFINRFDAQGPSEVWLATALPGDIRVHPLNGEKIVLAGGNWVASDSGVHIDLEWQGLKSFFSGENLFWVKASGHGNVLLNSFGFIYEVPVDGSYIVDTGHIVAFEETLSFNISKASAGWIESYFSGEGFVCQFKGKGKVWCQSHNPLSYGHELTPFLTPRRN
jgi:uncharacterized protein (TIGR00266 family)